MNFLNVFAYLELAAGIVGAVMSLLHLVSMPDPLTGAAILDAVNPVLAGLRAVVPKAVVPPDLALDVANAVADVVNRYYRKAGGSAVGAVQA